MIDTHELKKRDLYLNKIMAFQDTEPVKVVTGIRRCVEIKMLRLSFSEYVPGVHFQYILLNKFIKEFICNHT